MTRVTASQYFTFAGPMLLTVVAAGLVTMIITVVVGLQLLRRVVRAIEAMEGVSRPESKIIRRSDLVKRRQNAA